MRSVSPAGARLKLSPQAFVADAAVLYAVHSCILVIGETAGDLSMEGKTLAPGIPWPQIITMRHRLAHDYRAISDRIVYDTVIEDLPRLVAAILNVLGPDWGVLPCQTL